MHCTDFKWLVTIEEEAGALESGSLEIRVRKVSRLIRRSEKVYTSKVERCNNLPRSKAIKQSRKPKLSSQSVGPHKAESCTRYLLDFDGFELLTMQQPRNAREMCQSNGRWYPSSRSRSMVTACPYQIDSSFHEHSNLHTGACLSRRMRLSRVFMPKLSSWTSKTSSSFLAPTAPDWSINSLLSFCSNLSRQQIVHTKSRVGN